jgi:hypothetical protein
MTKRSRPLGYPRDETRVWIFSTWILSNPINGVENGKTRSIYGPRDMLGNTYFLCQIRSSFGSGETNHPFELDLVKID